MQRIVAILEAALVTHELPDETDEVVPGVRWGRFDALFSPAFWAWRGRLHADESRFTTFRLGADLWEEVAACILGGFGVTAEIGLAAYYRLRERGQIAGTSSATELYETLSEPLLIGTRAIKYRFPRQRSERLASAFHRLGSIAQTAHTAHELRSALLEIPGVGPKTASWIVRNHVASDDVAILDIHVCRACTLAGIFPESINLNRDYFHLETRFLQFAEAIGVRAAVLDALMWHHMRNLGKLARNDH